MNKLSFNIHPKLHPQRDYSAEETAYLFDLLGRIAPPAMLFMDNPVGALRAKQIVESSAVVLRHWRADEGSLFTGETPAAFFAQYNSTPRNLVLNVLNEPSGFGDLRTLAHWCAEVMELFGKAGQSIVVPNFGEGHPDVDRLGELEELWTALDKWHDVHYYGTHEYGTWRGLLFRDGGKFDVFPWRIGRFETFVVPYLKQHSHKIPHVIITEFGCDSAHDSTNKRGWRDAWSEQAYFDQLKSAVDTIYKQPHYVGLCLFCYGNTGKDFTESDWRSFDIADAKTLHGLMEVYAKIPAPTPVPVPIPAPPPAPVPTPPPAPVPTPTPGIVQITRQDAIFLRDSYFGLYTKWKEIAAR